MTNTSDPIIEQQIPQMEINDDFKGDALITITGDTAQAKAGFVMNLLNNCFGMFTALLGSIWNDLFSQDMDFISKMLVVVLGISLLVEALFLLTPRFVRGYIVKLDRSNLNSGSRTGHVAFFFGVWCAITKLTELSDSWKHKSRKNKDLFKTG